MDRIPDLNEKTPEFELSFAERRALQVCREKLDVFNYRLKVFLETINEQEIVIRELKSDQERMFLALNNEMDRLKVYVIQALKERGN